MENYNNNKFKSIKYLLDLSLQNVFDQNYQSHKSK
jgi:hypothetical protein